VKVAIVMGRLGLEQAEARRRLDEAGGVITRVTGDLERPVDDPMEAAG
jgi:N-acetylmuramic acid 6-phosphate (MurNAc-6-P) etherase